MRIVITRNGKKIVHEFEDELPDNSEKQKSNYIQSSSMSKLPIIYSSNEELFKKYSTKNNEFLHKVLRYRDTFQSKRSSSIIDKTALESFYNRDESKINLNELNQAKRIKLSQPKINMSQAFLDKYDDYDINFKKKLTELSNNLISKNSSPQKSEENKEKEKNNEDKNTNTNLNNNINQNLNNNINYNNINNLGNNYNNFGKNPNEINNSQKIINQKSTKNIDYALYSGEGGVKEISDGEEEQQYSGEEGGEEQYQEGEEEIQFEDGEEQQNSQSGEKIINRF